MSAFLRFSTYIEENVESLAVDVVEGVLHKMELGIPQWEKEQALNMYVELLLFFGKSLVEDGKESAPDFFIDWSKKNAAMQIASGGKISEIAVRYTPTREVLTDLITKISLDLDLSVKEHAFIINRFNTLLDVSLNETIFAFERLFEESRKKTQKELAALSAPVIPVKDGIVILPLIGDIDTYRAKYIMEQIVPKIAEMNVNYVIADFSGMYTINTDIAEYLHQIGRMLELIGIHVITTGLRPELAQTVVNSQINISTLHTFSNVKKALESIK